MVSEKPYPSGRSTARPSITQGNNSKSPEATTIPWIDIHQHTGSLTWNDRHRFDLSGGRAVVMIAADYYSAPNKPLSVDDVTYLWDSALENASNYSQCHFHNQYVAVGIHTWSRVEDHDRLLELLPEYCTQEGVIAIGETGIESIHHTASWDLESQRDAVAGQMRIARDTGLPVLVHTPGSGKGSQKSPTHAAAYEQSYRNFTEPLFDPETAKLDAVKLDVQIMDDIGLADEQVVIDHADPSVVPYVIENTNCYLAFTIGKPQLRGLYPEDIAEILREYGPDRIVLDTDLSGSGRNDPFILKETMLDLQHLGIDRVDVEKICYKNPKRIIGLND